MSKLIKLDLHTHPIEALKAKMGIEGVRNINKDVAGAIVQAVKAAGLDGIAITEHNNFNHSWVTCLEISENFRKENLIILPGEEVDCGNQQFLHLYIPDYARRIIPFFKGKSWFNILAHPGFYNPIDMAQFNNLEYDAVEEESLHGTFPAAGQISGARNLPLTRSSDAHKLEDLGFRYTELETTSKRH